MLTPLTRKEIYSFGFLALLALLAALLPTICQPESYHHFADQRNLASVPHFSDVASNLIFVLVGVAGIARLWTTRSVARPAATPVALFFGGLLLTGFGSAYYHWAPDSGTLLWDRMPMVVTFAGVIGAFLTQRVSARAGRVGVAWALLLGGAGLVLSEVTGNLSPYLALQFGGLLGLVIGLVCMRDANDTFPWPALLGWYALAKVLELGDVFVWELTGQLVSGHTLKHLAAGMAGVALLRVLTRGAGRQASLMRLLRS